MTLSILGYHFTFLQPHFFRLIGSLIIEASESRMPKPRSEERETPASCRITGSRRVIFDLRLSGVTLVVNFRQGSWLGGPAHLKQDVSKSSLRLGAWRFPAPSMVAQNAKACLSSRGADTRVWFVMKMISVVVGDLMKSHHQFAIFTRTLTMPYCRYLFLRFLGCNRCQKLRFPSGCL